MKSNTKALLTLVLITLFFLQSRTQDVTDSTFWFGTQHGMMVANVNFNPLIDYSTISSYSGGLNILYMNEKNIGIGLEANFVQGGWDEGGLYEKRFSMFQLPLYTQFQIGKKNFKVLIQAGPNLSFLLNESSNQISDTLSYNYYFTSIENNFFTGITGGLGFRYVLKENQSISIEGRFNQGLTGIFDQNGNTEFVLSQPQFFGGYIKYQRKLFKSKPKIDDSLQRDSEN
ncbi:MAG: PorT family protein [Flavobacteriales bacterium]|nr:PorT family protein [Flavobacteriales bacterium]